MPFLLMNRNPAPVEFGAIKCPSGVMVEMDDETFAMLMKQPASRSYLEGATFEVKEQKSEPKADKKGK